MDVGLILKIAGVGLLVATAFQVLNKAGRDEMATLVTVAGVILVLSVLAAEIDRVFTSVKNIFGL